MDILRQQQDDVTPAIWHFKLGGIAQDGLYRLADLSRETTSPADWLAANQAEAQALIDAGVYHEELVQRLDLKALGEQVAAELAYLDTTIANIDTYTAAQVRDVVKRLCQEQRAELRAWRYVVKRLVS